MLLSGPVPSDRRQRRRLFDARKKGSAHMHTHKHHACNPCTRVFSATVRTQRESIESSPQHPHEAFADPDRALAGLSSTRAPIPTGRRDLVRRRPRGQKRRCGQQNRYGAPAEIIWFSLVVFFGANLRSSLSNEGATHPALIGPSPNPGTMPL